MKQGLSIFAAIVLLFQSCVSEVEVTFPDADERVIINSYVDAAENEHAIFLGLSRANSISPLYGQNIKCTINGKPVTVSSVDAGKYDLQAKYLFSAQISSGDKINIELDYEGNHVFSEIIVPSSSLSIASIDSLNLGDATRFGINIDAGYVDEAWYRLQIKKAYRVGKAVSSSDTLWIDSGIMSPKVDISSCPILSGGNISSSEGADDFIGTFIENKWMVFTNSAFPGTGAKLLVTIDKKELEDFEQHTYYDGCVLIEHSLIATVRSISKAEYDYLRVMNIYEANGYFLDELAEPVSVPSNVTGGEGFIGASVPISYNFRLFTKKIKSTY